MQNNENQEIIERDDDFATLLENYLPQDESKREKVTGTVSQIDRSHVYLDAPNQRTGIRVRIDEVPEAKLGDEIEVLLVGTTEDGEFLLGSRRRIEMEEGNKDIDDSFENQKVLTAKIVRSIKGGFILEFHGVQGFLPSSLSEIPHGEEESFVGKEIQVIVKDLKKGIRGRKITFSKKDITLENAAKEYDAINEGDVVKCQVVRITHSRPQVNEEDGEDTPAEVEPREIGLSVSVGAVHGFIHISEVSWKRLEKLSAVYKPGDELEAKVIEKKDNKSLKLSVKALSRDPWAVAAETVKVGDELDGTVTRIMPYGIFVEAVENIDGLVHTSDFTWNRKKINFDDYVKVGDKIKVKVLELDAENRKLKLGVKQLSVDPWNEAADKYAPGTIAMGKVVDLMPFGIFAQVENGVDVFIHQSDYSWKRDEHITFDKGDEIQFEITEINLEERKLKGSIKKLTKSPWDLAREEYKLGDVVEKHVKRILDFGMFIELAEGVDGFIPLQLASKDFIKDLNEKFKVEDVVKAKIIEIDDEKLRIKLSIKKLELDEEKKADQELLDKYGTSGSIDE